MPPEWSIARSFSAPGGAPRRAALASLAALALAGGPARALVITEIHYNPPLPAAEERRLEFIEVFNENAEPLDLSGYFFSRGVQFAFPEGTFLEGYGFLVVCADEARIRTDYGIENVLGDWSANTSLDNSGETVAIANPSGIEVAAVRYNDRGRWPAGADGTGHTLSLRYASTDMGEPESWTFSAEPGGTPGRSNFGREGGAKLTSNPGLDLNGFITTWLVLGPYGDNDICVGRDRTRDWLAGGGTYETDLVWTEGQQVPTDYGGESVANRLHPNGGTIPTVKEHTSLSGAINLNDAVWPPDPQNVMGYAMVYVDNLTPGPLDVDVGVASDDAISVLVNGEYVLDVAACRGLAEGVQDRGGATLSPGKNLIVTKTFELIGGFSFRLRLEERGRGLPITSDRTIEVMTDVSAGLGFGEVGPPLGDPPPDPPPTASGEPFPVVFNEALLATAGERWVELYNTSLEAVDLSGYHLTDDRLVLAKAQLPSGTIVPGRGWLALAGAPLGLSLAPDGPIPGGRTWVALVSRDGRNVLDACSFEPASEEMSEARWPDGGNGIEPSALPTPGEANRLPGAREVVIDEIMYHPIDEDPRREFIELYNRGPLAVDLTGWRLTGGVNFDFPPQTAIGPGGYLVVGRYPGLLRQVYGLGEGAVVGPPQDAASLEAFGVLRDSGERVTLRDERGNTADEVRYADGGEWPRWPDGGGSSLELVDPRADNSNPQAWDSSDDSSKAPVDSFTYQGRFEGGEPELQLFLLSRGISVLDDLRLIGEDSTLLVEDQAFIEVGDRWRYLKGTAAPPADWRQIGFDASGWSEGPTGIGYGDGDDATLLGDMQNGYMSIFCRRVFQAPDPATVERLFFEIDYDDGFVAYLNGSEVARRGLTGNPPAHTDGAVSHDAGSPEVIDITDKLGFLTEGGNVLAVQVHNTSLGSTDLSFIPRLLSAHLEEVPGGANLLPNGDFEANASGWRIEGTHIHSGRTPRAPISGAGSLKVVSTGRGDNKVNRIERDLPAALSSSVLYTVSFKARWVVGSQSLVTRGYNHSYPRSHQLSVPMDLGTPGAVNSASLRRRVAGRVDIGPVIGRPLQVPAVPEDGEQVEVSARVDDPDGVEAVSVFYAIDTPLGFAEVPMEDPDGDGVWRGTLPGQPLGTKVVFYIGAVDAGGLVGRYPVDVLARANPTVLDPGSPGIGDQLYCVYRHHRRETGSYYPSYRFWLHRANEDYLSTRRVHSNDMVEGSFVFGGTDIYHNAEIRFAGSPFLRGGWGGSVRIHLPKDRPLHGTIESFNLDNHGADARERISHYLIRLNSGAIRVPYSTPRLAYFQANDRSSGVFEHVHVPDEEFIRLWFGDDDEGDFFELDDRFEFNDSGGMVSSENARWTYPPYRGSGADKENYRFYFNLRSDEDEDDYSHLIATADFMTNASDAEYDAGIWDHLNVEEMLRIWAIRLNTDDWDTWGASRGKNCYIYRPASDGRFHLFAWDMELTYGNPGGFPLPATPAGAIGYGFGEVNRLLNRPRVKRMYYGILKEMVDRRFRSDVLAPYLELLAEAGMGRTDIGMPGGFIDQRRALLLGWIDPVVYPRTRLRITTNGGASFTVASETVDLAGTAPVEVRTLVVESNGETIDPGEARFSDSSMVGWDILDLSLVPGPNDIRVLGFDTFGDLIDSASIRVTGSFTWPKPVVTGIEPAEAPPGDAVLLRGTGFHPRLRAFFGGVESPRVILDPGAPEAISVEVPPDLAAGGTTVVVRNADGKVSDPVPFTVSVHQRPFVRGDANSDRRVDVADPIRILFHLFAGEAAVCEDALDANDDGSLDLTDVIGLLEYLFLDGPPPSPPFPSEGPDQGSDGLECQG